jgi:hypothetical protein
MTRFLSTISAAAELCCLQQICNNLKTISINIYLFNSYIKGKWSNFFFFLLNSPKFLTKFRQSLPYTGRSQVIDNLSCTQL